MESGLLNYKYAVTSFEPAKKSKKSKAADTSVPTINWESITAANLSSLILATDGKPNQKCSVQVTDDSGEYSSILTADITISADMFKHFGDQADEPTDYTADLKGWDGALINSDPQYEMSATAANGVITLTSSHANLNTRKEDNGAILYKEVEGDFLIQTKVVALDGQEARRTPAYNEGGLIVLDDSGMRGQEIIHVGAFPSYNCGNMLTHVRGYSRPQYPRGNGWDYDPYLQIERTGDTFTIRTSKDGKSWTDMPGSPIQAPQLHGKKLKVGLYQTTYTDNKSWVSFDEFNLWEK